MNLVFACWCITDATDSVLSGLCFSPCCFLFDSLHFSSFLSSWVSCIFHRHSWNWATTHYCLLSINQTIVTAVKASSQHLSFLFFESSACLTITTVCSKTLFAQMLFCLQFGYWSFFTTSTFLKTSSLSVSLKLLFTTLILSNTSIKVILSSFCFPVQCSWIFASQMSFFIDLCQHKYCQLLFPPLTPIFKPFYEAQNDFLSPAWLIMFNPSFVLQKKWEKYESRKSRQLLGWTTWYSRLRKL